MARNLLDDDDWNRLGAVVSAAVSTQIEMTENGILARLDKRAADQAITLEAIRAQMGEPPAEVVALRTRITEIAGRVAQLRRSIGSGNLETELNAQVSTLFAELADLTDSQAIPNVPLQPEPADAAP